MIERGDRVSFAFEPLAESLGGDLDRNNAVQARVAGLVHLAHTTSSQRREDLVGSETGSRGDRHGNCRVPLKNTASRSPHSSCQVKGIFAIAVSNSFPHNESGFKSPDGA